MPNIRIIKRRIKSAKNIGQVTKALEMISAIKMRKAQESAMSGKPYTLELRRVLSELSGKVDTSVHPFLNTPENISRITVVVIGPDKGLAGALITNLLRKVNSLNIQINSGSIKLDDNFSQSEIKLTNNIEVSAISWGKKAREIVKKMGWKTIADFTNDKKESLSDQIRALSILLTKSYLNHETDMVIIAFSDFINTITQKPKAVQFLPMVANNWEENQEKNEKMVTFEPSPEVVLRSLLDHYQLTVLQQIIFDGRAAEHSARMVAMKNANDNAKDIIKGLTLEYNQTRQSAITNEIADIVSGSLVK